MIGSVLKKMISGGERKRTSIGVELITDPSVILLDEPTSGLDSFMAKNICKLLQDLAHI
jgi:ABC-type multidrug transport system ATPase subunit